MTEHDPMAFVEETLGEAHRRLEDRQRKLQAIIKPAEAELREIEKALKRIGQPPKPSPRSTQSIAPAPKPARVRAHTTTPKPPKPAGEVKANHPDKGALVLRVLYRHDPERKGLSPKAIADHGEISARGLHFVMDALARQNLVRQVGRGFWTLSATGAAEAEEGA